MKHKLLRILPFLLLGGVLGLAAAPAAFEIAGVEASATGDLYSLVTDASTLKAGDVVLFVYHSGDTIKANGALTGESNAYLNVYDAYFEDEYLYFDNSNIKPLTVGVSNGAYTFTYGTRTIAANAAPTNHMSYSTKNGASATWNVSIDSSTYAATIQNTNTNYGCIQYNPGGVGRFSNYNNTMSNGQIYRKGAAAKEIQLNKTELQQNVGTTFTLTASGKDSYVPESYVWSIEEGSEYVSLSTTTGNSTVVTFNYEGSAVVKCVADGKADATCTINVTDYQYNILEKDKYFIAESSGLAMLGSDLSYIGNVDFSDESNLWTLEKAYQGDNSYYVTNGEQYLAYNRDIPGHEGDSKESKIALTDEPINAWTVSTKDTNYVFSTLTKKGQTRSLAVHEETWYAFEGTSNYVKFLETGEFDDYVVDKLPTKTKYYVGEKFSTTNMKVTGYYTNGYSADITNKIVWADLTPGTQVHGTFTSGEVAYDIVVNGISVLGPKAGSMAVTGLRHTYLIGEMPKETIEEVKVTYSDGVVDEVKTLKDTEFDVSPAKINSSTTKIVVSMVDDPEVKFEKEITAEHAKYFATNMIEIGDKVTLGTTVGAEAGNITGGQEIAMVDGQLGSQTFGYLPTPAMEFEVVQGVSAGSYAFKYNDMYLTSNGKTLDFGHVSNITGYKNDKGTWYFEYPVMLPGQSEPLKVTLNENQYVPGDFSGSVDSYEKNAWIDADALMDGNEILIMLDIYHPRTSLDPTHQEFLLDCEIDGGELIIYLPSQEGVNTKNSFTCNYVEPQNDWLDPYWEICPLNEPEKHVYLNADSGKFGVSTSGDYDIMLYRDMTRDFSHEIKSISVSIPEDMPTTVELGEPFNWVGITVKAKYDNTTKKLPLGAYEVDVPASDTYGDKICTVTYGTSGNKVTTTFKFTVVGGYQPFIKQNTYEVWVDDTNTFTTTQEPPEGQPVTWSSSNPEIADFEDPSVGDLTSYKSGKVTIKVTSYDGYYSDSKELTVSQRPTGLTLDTTEKTIKQGEKFTIVGTVSPADATNKTVLWSSSDPEIATVSLKGEVTGLGIGDVVITGQTQGKGTGEEEGYKATCTVHVEEGEVVRVTGVSLDCDYKELKPGDTFQLNAIVNPSNATNKNVTWESNAPHLADVSNSGKVTVKNSADTGKTVYITCTTEDGGFTTRCEIKIKASVQPIPVTSVTLNTTSKQIEVDGTFELIATVKPDNADTKQVSFETLDGDIVSINQTSANKATITGLKEGTAVIEASCGGKTARCTVTVGQPVVPVPVESVSLNKTEVELAINAEEQLTATINPSNADNQAVSWKSSDTKVVTVNSDGKIKAVGVGEAIITVKTNDGGKTATCKVTVTQKGANYTGIAIGVGCGVGAVGIGCGVGIPLGIKAHKKRKIAK